MCEKYANLPKSYLEILGIKSVDEIDSVSEDKWELISFRKKLPERFLDIFKDKLAWNRISMYSLLSD